MSANTTAPRITGGIELPRYKPGLDAPPVEITRPDTLIFPLAGYRGEPLPARVHVGQAVRQGQLLADGIVATNSGHVQDLREHPFAHPSGLSVPSVFLQCDSTDAIDSISARPLSLEAIRNAGIMGHGGAGFSTFNKLAAVGEQCHYLLINAAECEPGIACDEALLLTDIDGVLCGVSALMDLLRPSETVLVIEQDKLKARKHLEHALHISDLPRAVSILDIQARYPSGAERVLVDLVLRERAHGVLARHERPTHRGIVCLNLATVHAIGALANGQMANQRLVTVDGRRPCHARVTLGTPIRHVLQQTGNLPDEGDYLRIGGPLSGYEHADMAAPVSVHVNALSVAAQSEPRPPLPCIRCGDCVPVCPVGLYPQQLHSLAQARDDEGLSRQGLDHCIACGCCDLVCPSAIPLTASFREAQRQRTISQAQDQASAAAAALHARHNARKQRDANRHITGDKAPGNSAVASALARARRKRTPKA